MSISHVVGLSCGSSQSGSAISVSETRTGSYEVNLDITVPDGSTNYAVIVGFDKDSLSSVFMVCDTDLTVKTNSSGSPANTITLIAGVAYEWSPDTPGSNPFAAADVTALYLTNGSGNSRFQMMVLHD